MVKINNKQHMTKQGTIKRNPPKNNSSEKRESYEGKWITNEGVSLSFSLYSQENIKFEETKKNILDNMNEKHLVPLRNKMLTVGLYLHGFEYYSPKQYNYQGDSLDLVISVVDREKLKRFIRAKSSDIQKMLSQNKSYDGYMALTSSDVREVIEKLDEDFEVDVIVINYILLHYPLDFEDDFYFLLIEDEDDDEDD